MSVSLQNIYVMRSWPLQKKQLSANYVCDNYFSKRCNFTLITVSKVYALSRRDSRRCWMVLCCEPFSPLQPSKTPETPNLSKICPSDCFGGFQSGGLKFGKICLNLKNGNFRTNFDNFFQISGLNGNAQLESRDSEFIDLTIQFRPQTFTFFGQGCQNGAFGKRSFCLGPPGWNPPKQSLGQILDKFGVSGVFEGCIHKGEQGSQVLWPILHLPLESQHSTFIDL